MNLDPLLIKFRPSEADQQPIQEFPPREHWEGAVVPNSDPSQ